MYRSRETLRDREKYRQELCFVVNILGLIMINKNKQLHAISKLIISLRLYLQVNTCQTLVLFSSISEDSTRFWEGLF